MKLNLHIKITNRIAKEICSMIVLGLIIKRLSKVQIWSPVLGCSTALGVELNLFLHMSNILVLK
jgi:hypothetical protein